MKQPLRLTVNGVQEELPVDPWRSLSEVLRDDLNLTGTKEVCISGVCGACTVLVDGQAVKSCVVLALQADGRQVTTIEGLAQGDQLHPIQQAFLEHYGYQCGFCTPGMIMATRAILEEHPDPSEQEIKEMLHGNLCRCTGYVKIVESVLAAAQMMSK